MTKIRVRERERELLKDLQEVPEVREMAVDEGIIDSTEENLSYEKILRLIIPDDADVLSRPESEMVWITAHDMSDEVLELAGENVSAHRVVKHYTSRFMEEEGVTVELDDE